MGELNQPERMADFFDVRAEGYEAHMERTVESFDRFYASIASPILATEAVLQILDIGCGTGLELDEILRKVPNAVVTGLDVSVGMLSRLRAAYADRSERLILVQGSYLEVPLVESVYDYVVAVMTLHHLLPAQKRDLYRRIRRSLVPGGVYIHGDWVVSPEDERRYLAGYDNRMQALGISEPGSYHIDIPLSLETETRLLLEAGFSAVDVIWESDGNAIAVASG